jgi:hypothetical protein
MGQGSVYRRGKCWWLHYHVDGRRYRESAETTRKERADAICASV